MNVTDELMRQVWRKGIPTPNNDQNIWRKDACGAWIKFADYGDRDSAFGWEIDHIKPGSWGGDDNLANLRPLQWENNAARQDTGKDMCVVTADETKNVRRG